MKAKSCIWCKSRGLRRVNRVGFFRRNILTFFGIFPWECMTCRRKSYFRDSGHATGETHGV